MKIKGFLRDSIIFLSMIIFLTGCEQPLKNPENNQSTDTTKLEITLNRISSGMQIDWPDVIDCDSYRIYRRDDPDADWIMLKTVTTSEYFDEDMSQPWLEYKVDALSSGTIAKEGEPKSYNFVREYFVNEAGRSAKYLITKYDVNGSKLWNLNCYFTYQTAKGNLQTLLCTPTSEYDRESEPLRLFNEDNSFYITGCFGNDFVKSLASNLYFKPTWELGNTLYEELFRNATYRITHENSVTVSVNDIDGNPIDKTFTDCIKVAYNSTNTSLQWKGAKGIGYYLYKRGEGIVYHEQVLSQTDYVGNAYESYKTYQLEPSTIITQAKTIIGKTVSKKSSSIPASRVQVFSDLNVYNLTALSDENGQYQIQNIYLPDNINLTVYFDYDINGDGSPDNNCFNWSTMKTINTGASQQIVIDDFPIYYYTTAPTIISSVPENNATNVSINQTYIQIVFDQIMSSSKSFDLPDYMINWQNSWTYDYDKEQSTYTVISSKNPSADTTYSIIINPPGHDLNTKNVCGYPAETTTISFTTAP